ncbi:MAG TPA: C1 family peptidase [Pirellulales bacterium]|jgi:hypothetical protein|nr:C1 family peptidase [Pirellulales bacterium]
MSSPFRSALLVCALLGELFADQVLIRAADALPKKVSLIAQFEKLELPPVAQGDRDVCSLFAITALAEFESRAAAATAPRLSEEYLIWASREASGKKREQAMFYEALAGLDKLGICSADEMPYVKHAEPKAVPSLAAIAAAGKLGHRWHAEWIKRWSLDRPLSGAELEQVKAALAGGHPVACGLRWPKELSGAELLDVPSADRVFDGHSVVLVGYDDGKNGGQFQFRNSYGPKWGEHGYGTLSYAYARAYANDAVSLRLEAAGEELPLVRYAAEKLPIAAQEACDAHAQRMDAYERKLWTGGSQLLCVAKRGGFVEFNFDVATAGRYRVRALLTAAPDFAQVRIGLDGHPAADTDLYAGRVCPAGSVELGTHDLSAGPHRWRVTAVAKDPQSKGFSFGIDTLDLLSAKP